MNIHYMLSKAQVSSRPSVLWCYKKDLGFSSHKKKRMKHIKNKKQAKTNEDDTEDPFELFVSSTDIRYCYYSETEKVLGNTFGMCILQDFESITPNILARTIETVQGGGIIIFLFKSMNSLQQIYSLNMDVHSRYRTDSHTDVVGRFNERFFLSLTDCDHCLVMDDKLKISKMSTYATKPTESNASNLPPTAVGFFDESLPKPLASLVGLSKTMDQADALKEFYETIQENHLRTTVSLTAARGRGKSATLGLAVAAAIEKGFSNIFITSPTPENLKTLFDFIFKGFDALGYTEHIDYSICASTDPELENCITRVEIFKNHRQTIQVYIL